MRPPADMTTVRERLRAMFGGRPAIATGGPLAGLTRQVDELTAMTGRPPFLLAYGVGTGLLPPPDATAVHVLATSGEAMLASVRAMLATLADLPRDAVDAIDEWDPRREAVVLAGPFFTGRELAGRPVLDGRHPQWAAVEDKSTVDALWDALDVARSPATVDAATHRDLIAAAGALDRGAGTVWSGDSREGLNGGAEYVRWVRSDAHARAATDFFAEHCDRVRVMPFLEGLPCSIHGVVFPDGVAALRPVEMLTLRRLDQDTDRLLYGGISTHWDPPDADRAVMRDVARRAAEGLRDRVDFRGGFSVDGVLTGDGFLPTELNSRFSGGLSTIAKGLPDFPLALVQAALVSGHDPGMSAAEFEAALVESADEHRYGGGSLMLSTVRLDETDLRGVRLSDGPLQLARSDEESEGELMLGPAPTGAFLRFEPHPGLVARGASLAPLVSEAFALADQVWGTGIGPTQPARDVRAVGSAVGGGR